MGRDKSSRLRRQLVERLIAEEDLRDSKLEEAFLSVPRELFVPKFASQQGLEAVYRDESIITRKDGRGAPTSSSSQPRIMALMLDRLQLAEGMRVLEVGAGTGYNAALLSHIVGRSGRVVSIELNQDPAGEARAAIASAGARARVVVGDGRLGWAEGAPYDRIIVTASAESLYPEWLEQLRADGLLQVPLRLRSGPDIAPQAISTFRKAKTEARSVSVLPGGFMPLRDPGEDRQDETTRLTAMDFTGREARQLAYLVGPALETLSVQAHRRLLSLALSRPRASRVRLSQRRRIRLSLFLSLELPHRSLVFSLDGAMAIGVVGPGSRSLALFSGDPERPPRILAYGEPQAEETLRAVIGQWRKRGEPGEDDLRVVVPLGRQEAVPRWRWQDVR